jgi:large repetitive protein
MATIPVTTTTFRHNRTSAEESSEKREAIMKSQSTIWSAAFRRPQRSQLLWAIAMLPMVLLVLALGVQAQTVNLSVTGPSGNGSAGRYRWVIEEDQTYHHDPANYEQVDILGQNFHRSHMPVVAIGRTGQPPRDGETDLSTLNLDPTKHYFISVLPTKPGRFAMGGAPIAPGQTDVSIKLNELPTPTAQISVFVFEDINPISNVPDLPVEQGLANFEIELAEAAGQYGANGGPVTQDAFGNPVVNAALDGVNDPGQAATAGRIVTNEFGVAIIKNLPPAKYGLTVRQPLTAPPGEWIQTSTIEGTKTIDAWVKANEPPYFTEFGPAGHHADFGFVRRMDGTQDNNNDGLADLNGAGSISGRVVNTHMSRPPDYTFYPGHPFPDCWVGLNDAAGIGIYVNECNADSTFSIDGVADGTYSLSIWDSNLDVVFASTQVIVGGPNDNSSLGDVGVFNWNARLRGTVFNDLNQNGIRDAGEEGIFSAVSIRWRDGTVYDAGPTEFNGDYEFAEVFPFFSWLVAEVDFAAPLKATGMTAWVDAGGPVDPAFEDMNPQEQPGGAFSRTETGEVLTQGIQTFLGQTNIIDWGKTAYDAAAGENGGISGIVFYDTTRAEDNPMDAVGETWQPGIPRVQVNLYADADFDGVIDDGGDGFDPPDVDNYPLGNFPGPEDTDNYTIGVFDNGDAIDVTWTDSWDDSLPEGCPGGDPSDGVTPADKCYDGLRNWNQVRDAVFDGGYAFGGYDAVNNPGGLAPGTYIVEAIPPPGYKLVRSHDKNVDFGEDYTPSPLAFPPECVGTPYTVANHFSLFSDPSDLTFPTPPLAGTTLPDCDRKQLVLTAGLNAPADFFLFTDTPVSARVKGFMLDDLANEFDPNNPNFGEKYAPPNLPVAFYDYTGNEITRVYSDRVGNYNALVPSTYTTNIASPSGMSPNMLIACMNDPGPIPDGGGGFIVDPNYNPQYTQFCYTFQYMPGTTTYLDTPVLPIAAFAGQNQNPLDCEYPNGTPMISYVSGIANGIGGGPYTEPGQVLRILSRGTVNVTNPDYVPGGSEPETIPRNYLFGGAQGQVLLTDSTGADTLLTVNNWASGAIRASVPGGTPAGAYQLTVVRSDGTPSPYAVTVTVGPLPGGQSVLAVRPSGYSSIQAAIDAAQPGDIVMVGPGVYEELVVMWKPVQLQGWGADTVVINAVKRPGERLQQWRDLVTFLVTNNDVDLLPGQNIDFDPANNEPGLLTESEGAGILVIAKNDTPANGGFGEDPNARIDGVSITGADIGGGIVVNGYAPYLQISNNRIFGNEGHNGGGIQVGHPFLGDGPTDAVNDNINIHHNWISKNGSPIGYPGGIALYTGTDGYSVSDNYICGNFATGSGGGIGHVGLSDGGRIEDNEILFNQSFSQSPVDIGGGGIAIEGAQVPGDLTAGAGNVTIVSNHIQGNVSGAGDGGGIRLAYVNGQDVVTSPATLVDWYRIDLFNNMIHNNVAGNTGAGISLQDATNVRIWNNTIAHNDSTATVGALIDAVTNMSTAQAGAGMVSRAHTPALEAVIVRSDATGWSRPRGMRNNIIFNNRSFQWQIVGGVGELSLIAGLDDLAVIGTNGQLAPTYCLLTDRTGYGGTNVQAHPNARRLFIKPYFNGPSGLTALPENSTPLTAAATDEGGNFIDIRFSQLTPVGDYHILPGSRAVDVGFAVTLSELAEDIDNDARTINTSNVVDIGADEVTP